FLTRSAGLSSVPTVVGMVGLLCHLLLLFGLGARTWPGSALLLVNDKITSIYNQGSILRWSAKED
ncbi:hypothetical protein, partial [Roseibium sp.]|uniref:hypothetical protein n=1 Tax=Roseibium sp. TaxID=1936156 RepID=UPI00326592DB